jgi:hypothetical protein
MCVFYQYINEANVDGCRRLHNSIYTVFFIAVSRKMIAGNHICFNNIVE